jgi:hypothetical protein
VNVVPAGYLAVPGKSAIEARVLASAVLNGVPEVLS